MLTKTIIAASALLSMAAAVPLQQHNKRDVVWETRTQWDVTTIDVTTTVWLSPGETAPAGVAPPAAAPTHFGHKHKKPKPSSASPSPSPSPYSSPSPSPSASPAAPSSPPEQSPPPAAPTSTPVYSAPPVASTPAPSPTTSSPPAASPSSGGGSPAGGYPSNGLTGDAAAGTSYTGDFTWYQTGLGACGITSSPSDHIVAIGESLFDLYTPPSGNPNDNALCGKTVELTGVDGTIYPATIVDRCTGCDMSSLDLSEDFFNLVTNYGNGRVSGMSWAFA